MQVLKANAMMTSRDLLRKTSKQMTLTVGVLFMTRSFKDRIVPRYVLSSSLDCRVLGFGMSSTVLIDERQDHQVGPIILASIISLRYMDQINRFYMLITW